MEKERETEEETQPILSAVEIQGITFSRQRLGGYSIAEVESFRDRMASDMQVLEERMGHYRTRIEALRTMLADAQSRTEPTDEDRRDAISRALIDAQNSAELTAQRAQKQAGDVIATAEAECEKMRRRTGIECQEMLTAAQRDVQDCLALRNRLTNELAAVNRRLHNQVEMLDRVEQELKTNTPVIAEASSEGEQALAG